MRKSRKDKSISQKSKYSNQLSSSLIMSPFQPTNKDIADKKYPKIPVLNDLVKQQLAIDENLIIVKAQRSSNEGYIYFGEDKKNIDKKTLILKRKDIISNSQLLNAIINFYENISL